MPKTETRPCEAPGCQNTLTCKSCDFEQPAYCSQCAPRVAHARAAWLQTHQFFRGARLYCCDTCNALFYSAPSRHKNNTFAFCSRACYEKGRQLWVHKPRRARVGKVEFVCERCQQPFLAYASQRSNSHAYCSRQCAGMAGAKRARTQVILKITCAQCGTEFSRLEKRVRARNFCSNTCFQAWRTAHKAAPIPRPKPKPDTHLLPEGEPHCFVTVRLTQSQKRHLLSLSTNLSLAVRLLIEADRAKNDKARSGN